VFRRIAPWPNLVTTCWKGHCCLLRLSTKMVVHLSLCWDTPVVHDDGKLPGFCLECKCRVCQNPEVALLAVFFRPLSKCYPLVHRPAVLRLLCVDETCSARRLFVSFHGTRCQNAEKRQGEVAVQVGTTHPLAPMLPGQNCVSVVGQSRHS